MKTPPRTLLKCAIGSVAMSFLSAAMATSAAMTPAEMAAAIVRAQEKMQRAQAIANRYADRASIEGFTNDSWRIELMTNLLQGTDEGYETAAAAGTLTKALQAARQSSDRGQSPPQASNKVLGSPTADLTFIPMATPCRIVDTRSAGGPFGPGEVRTYTFRGGAAQGGVPGCDPKLSYPQLNFPAAMAINVGVIAFGLGGSPSVSGFVSVYPQGASASTAFLNFWGDDIISNAGVTGLTNGQFSVLAQFPTHITVDYFGSFVTPQFTVLSCLTTAENSATMSLSTGVASPAFFGSVPAPDCPIGYAETAIYCRASAVYDALSAATNGGECFGNTDDSTHTIHASRRCCRTPGD